MPEEDTQVTPPSRTASSVPQPITSPAMNPGVKFESRIDHPRGRVRAQVLAQLARGVLEPEQERSRTIPSWAVISTYCSGSRGLSNAPSTTPPTR